MKWLRISFTLFIVVIALAILAYFLLPSYAHYSKYIKINAPASLVYKLIEQHEKGYALWKKETNPTDTNFCWKKSSSNSDEGCLQHQTSSNNQNIIHQVELNHIGNLTEKILLSENSGATNITVLTTINYHTSPIDRVKAYFNQNILDSGYDNFLSNLKTDAELMANTDTTEYLAGFEVNIEQLPETKMISVRKIISSHEVSNQMAKMFQQVISQLKKHDIKEYGHPLCIWHSKRKQKTEIEVAITLPHQTDAAQNVVFSNMPSSKAVVVRYFGAYSQMYRVYDAINEYMHNKLLVPNGPAFEKYITDPGVEPDTSKWLTEIVFPVFLSSQQ